MKAVIRYFAIFGILCSGAFVRTMSSSSTDSAASDITILLDGDYIP